MEAQLPYPDLVDEITGPPMWHIISKNDRGKFACGMAIKVAGPPVQIELNKCDCVVCAELWREFGPWSY